MLRVEIVDSSDVAIVLGQPGELILFYSLWQSELWPDWMTHESLSHATTANQQHRDVIAKCQNGDALPLLNQGFLFNLALGKAVDKCKLLGLEVVSVVNSVIDTPQECNRASRVQITNEDLLRVTELSVEIEQYRQEIRQTREEALRRVNAIGEKLHKATQEHLFLSMGKADPNWKQGEVANHA